MNELLLIITVLFIYSSALVAYKLFGRSGLYALTPIATIVANIEVLLVIKAFGWTQTLGNLPFAVTFLITDILSECEGKREANKAVSIGIFSSIFFLIASQLWLLYTPDPADTHMPAFRVIFANTPRLIISSLLVYAISQFTDVWLYHTWWDLTTKLTGNRRRLLWFRNNFSTLISQFINNVLFTLLAFYGTYDLKTVWSFIVSSYIIFIITSLLDTPFVYAARYIHEHKPQQPLPPPPPPQQPAQQTA
jgi:hypothetical protein